MSINISLTNSTSTNHVPVPPTLPPLPQSCHEDRELLQLKQEELDQQLQSTKDAEERYHTNTQLIRDRMKVGCGEGEEGVLGHEMWV